MVGIEVVGIAAELVDGECPYRVHPLQDDRARRTMSCAYPTFHRAIDSALWSPPSSAAKMAGA